MTADEAIRQLHSLGAIIDKKDGCYRIRATTCSLRRVGDLDIFLQAVHTMGVATCRGEYEVYRDLKTMQQCGWLVRVPERVRCFAELHASLESAFEREARENPEGMDEYRRLNERIANLKLRIARKEKEGYRG